MVPQSAERSAEANELFVFEGYTSIVPIYEGAETYVFRAKSISTGAAVILKQTKNEYPTAREIGRLRREFLILRELGTDCAPEALSLDEHGRGVVLVMGDEGYPTLREILDAGLLDIERTLQLAISLSSMLALVHAKSVIHKDLSPRNVLVDRATWSVRLIDFGISARISREMVAPTAAKSLEGTPSYLSPEQTGRMNRAVDARSDLYSFGIILYEMLAGAPPFSDSDLDGLVQSHLAAMPVPLCERVPTVPAILSNIVMKLLEKMPEERYQSDAGLRLDLEECLAQWRKNGTIEVFPLRRRDKAPVLRGVQRLYGRDSDGQALLEAFEKTRQFGPELVLVRGYSGVGKSSLVHEIHRFIAQRRGGYFISGKFDKISQDIPLAPVINALRELMRQILTEPPAALEKWKKKILQALGTNGGVLCDIIPELVHVIGPQPPVAELDTFRAKNRFEMTLQDFLHVFPSAENPLVIFLDDLQWIDPASQGLLKLLLTDPFGRHLLYVGAYRDNEVDEGHPLAIMLADLAKNGMRRTDIDLQPLDPTLTTRFVADMLTSSTDEVQELAEVVFEKTQGNPFFIQQFLSTLIQRDLLAFDTENGTWRWNTQAIRSAELTDNVVELMIECLQRLSPETQTILTLASCIGHSFDLETLGVIADKPIADLTTGLFQAMKAGLILPIDNDYRFVEEKGVANDASLSRVRYAFVHDRVLQAAYSLANEEQHKALHLQIGRHLRKRIAGDPRDEDILDIVHHLNRGASGITDADERIDLVKLDLRAGRRAKAATAYHAATEYLRTARNLLQEENWENHYQVCFDLLCEAAECEMFRGDMEQFELVTAELAKRARTDLERVALMCLQMANFNRIARARDVLDVAADAFRLLGFPLEAEEVLSPQVLYGEVAKIDQNLKGRRILDLVDAPEIKDERLRAVVSVFDAIGSAAFMSGPIAFGVLNFSAVNFAIAHGFTDLMAFPLACVGYVMTGILNRVADGRDFSKLAVAVNKKLPNAVQTGRVAISHGSSLQAYAPFRDAAPVYAEGRQKLLDSGDFFLFATDSFLAIHSALFAGEQLDGLLEDADRYVASARRTRDTVCIISITASRQIIACLAGKTKSETSVSDDHFDEERDILGLDDTYFALQKAHHYVPKTLICLVHGDYPQALECADKAQAYATLIAGNPCANAHPFLHSLAILGSPRAEDPAENQRRMELLELHKVEIDRLAQNMPVNFAHMKALVEAERLRLSGDVEGTIKQYEKTILLAQEHKAPHFEALANEMAAKFFLSLGAPTGGSGYIKNAYRAYKHWGAAAKVADMEENTAHIWPALREITRSRTGKSASASQSAHTRTSRTLLDHTNIGGLRDAALVVRAAQEIASEIDLPRVIDRLAKLVLENAGADHGALILSRDGQLYVAAKLGADSSQLDRGPGKSLAESGDCAKSIVLYVARTQETVVIDNTSRMTRFADDPYLASGLTKAILAVPLLHQGRLSGVLYLENRSTAGIFNAARVELLTLLSSQAAIAIDIARLIEDARKANEEVRRTNEKLEQEVAHRTEELRKANESLSSAYQKLEQELLQRLEAEEQREALNAQMLSSQKERLAELSTPLLPIANDIVVIPLIGTMDSERADQVLSVALDGAQRLSARFVILDVTGLKHVDTHTAGMLANVAAALRLLGAETVITGIRPKIAQTLIALDVNLHSFVTMATLQSGMDYALKRSRDDRKANRSR